MTNHRIFAWVFTFVLTAAPLAFTQDQEPKEDMTFEDLRSSLSDLKKKETQEDDERRERIIRKTNNDTLEIYRSVLGKKNGDLENAKQRLAINLQLQAKYRKMLDKAQTDLAMLRSRYVNRTLALKRSLDEGRVSDEAYQKLVEEDGSKFRNREKEIVDDIAFYQSELDTASAKVKDMQLQKELLEFDPFEPEGDELDPEMSKRKRMGPADRIRTKLRTIARFRQQSVVDTLK